jgi:hypothetical protein
LTSHNSINAVLSTAFSFLVAAAIAAIPTLQPRYGHDMQWRVPTKITEPISGGSRVMTFTLDPRGNPLAKTVGTESRTTTYTQDDVGQMLTVDGRGQA